MEMETINTLKPFQKELFFIMCLHNITSTKTETVLEQEETIFKQVQEMDEETCKKTLDELYS